MRLSNNYILFVINRLIIKLIIISKLSNLSVVQLLFSPDHFSPNSTAKAAVGQANSPALIYQSSDPANFAVRACGGGGGG